MGINKEKRSPERLNEHYEIEKELADKLRHSSREDRKYMYTDLYDELFRRVPDHPQLTNKMKPEKAKDALNINMACSNAIFCLIPLFWKLDLETVHFHWKQPRS